MSADTRTVRLENRKNKMNIIEDVKLFFFVIKNVRSEKMNRAMIGYSIKEHLGKVTFKDILLFAEATGDKNTEYYKKTEIAPPFFLSKLIMPPIKKLLMHKDLKLNFLRLVHSGQEITWHSEIRVGDKLTNELTITDIKDISSGELLTISANIERNNEKIIEGIINIIIKGRKGKKEKSPDMDNKKKEKLRLVITTKDGQQIKYANISGDNNFIHRSNIIAKLAGLSRTIMHGACVMAMSCNTLMYLIKNDVKRLKSMSVQFGYPAIPGEILDLVMYAGKNKKEIAFSVLNQKRKKILKNCVLKFK